MAPMIRVLAISGSLRGKSSNKTVLQATELLAPEDSSFTHYSGLADLPHFNPDLEGNEGDVVADFRRQLQESHAVLICSPEYAHGVPGVLKNALDWVVGSGELVNKPTGLINASPRSTFAQASLAETLTVMSARLVQDACVTLPLWDKTLDAAGLAAHREISILLRNALLALIRIPSLM
jgi:chromate reductase, NAD(P)H dehydrogenase (quinone)